MKISCIILLLLAVFHPTVLQSQTTIKGNVTSNLEPVPNVNILLKRENNIIAYSISDSLGNYKLSFNEQISDGLFIETNSLSHVSKIVFLKEHQIFYRVELEERVNNLDEIFISNKKAIINKDTVFYNIDLFKDGTEEYVDDLLKKLPGIIIEEDGTIKYNNKKIKKLLLDGDDLFGSKYTVGSKNIDANMVDSVQVYKNFSENVLLKNIEDSDDVAINLSLKKEKADISGNARAGYGYKDRRDFHATAFLLKSRSKAFSVVSFNNVGVDKSPFLTTNSNTRHLISRGNYGSELEKKYHLINNSFYTHFSFIHRFSDHFKMNVNFNHLNDELSRNSIRKFTYLTPTNTFSTIETNRMESNPMIYDSEISLNYHNKDIMLNYEGNISTLDESFQNSSSNNFLFQENHLSTDDFSSIHKAELTYKINQAKVIINEFNYSFIRSTQDFELRPGYIPSDTVNMNFQHSNFSQEFFRNESKLYQNFSRLKMENALAFQLEENKFSSILEAENEVVGNYNNDLTQKKFGVEFYNSSSYRLNPRNELNLNLSLLVGKEQFYNLLEDQNILLLNYNLDYNLNITKKSTLSFFHSLDQETPRLLNLYNGRVLSSYRSIIENVPDFEKMQVSSFGFSYAYNDLINLTKFFLTFNYSHHNNGFYFQNYVDYDKTIIRSFLLNEERNSYNLMLTGEKFINPIRTTFSSTVNLAFDDNYNYVNNSELRDIKNRSMQINFKARTDFMGGRLNFENSINYFRQEVLVQHDRKSSFDKIFYTFNLNYQPFKKPIYFSSEIDFYHPNLDLKETFFFNNYYISYKPKNHKLEYSLKINDITNNTRYQNSFISDFYTSNYTYSLIGRNVLLSLKYKF